MKNILWLGLVVALWGCDPNRVYDSNKDLDGYYWHKDSVQTFTFEVGDASRPHHVFANLRNTADYPFHNLYYRYTLLDSAGQALRTTLKNIYLFDSKTGEPNGSGLGDLFDHRQVLLENYDFPYAGDFQLDLQQYMRRDSLYGVAAVGVRVEVVAE
ncbi:gliding motility lipoprotein GldH [Marinoscillum furvescens]|uniref:Gliding motility-associated lipoprotein GldH n=1 Tax=Marinoscillum furvescens DSM 4134 TaxID=1122208 RepID=A0A3D9L374_MARFU|nr:gliding motility lipoprotein GldH [Marinoscillum furvescens]RED99734.1 gliding motility-associated lipoprotein GldH [Marinoscillum furvescens DSM 4134]